MSCGALSVPILAAVYTLNRIMWAIYVYGFARGIKAMTPPPKSTNIAYYARLARMTIIPANDIVNLQYIIDACSRQSSERSASSQ